MYLSFFPANKELYLFCLQRMIDRKIIIAVESFYTVTISEKTLSIIVDILIQFVFWLLRKKTNNFFHFQRLLVQMNDYV